METKRSWWQQIKIHQVRTVLIALLAVVIVIIILSILGYVFNWDWTGLDPYVSPPHIKDSDFQRGKTLWDWLQLLIIPAVLAVAGYIINLTISRGEQEATKQRDKTAHEIAQDNQHGTMLQEYINQMSELILHEKLRESQPEHDVRLIARVRSVTILPPLDIHRKRIVVRFLYEARLIYVDHCIIDLSGADLIKAYLSSLDLTGANLSSTLLIGAELMGTKLAGANLSNAMLFGANLTSANLAGANLKDAFISLKNVARKVPIITNLFNADLTGANLSGARLCGADLRDTILIGADLTDADLTGARISDKQLAKTKSFKGATMQDGSIHE